MKRLLTYLFLGLLFISVPSYADDIRDFQIEGMSLGDSALDYFTEAQINNNKGPYYPNSNEFFYVTINKSTGTYDAIQFHVKTSDAKYILESIEGLLWYDINIKDCYRKMDEVVNSLSKTFKNIVPSKKIPLESAYGEGTQINFEFDSGDLIAVACNDYKKKYKDFTDNLKISIETKEFKIWVNTKAF